MQTKEKTVAALATIEGRKNLVRVSLKFASANLKTDNLMVCESELVHALYNLREALALKFPDRRTKEGAIKL